MNYELMYYVKFKDSSEAEGRIFFKDELYPVYNKNGNSLLVGENGEFYFTNDAMKEAIVEWELEVITND